MDKNLENFLITGKLSQSTLWDDQIGFFFLTIVFWVAQAFISVIIPVIFVGLEILLLVSCKMKEEKPYGNVYCGFIHMVIFELLWWIDGWCALSLVISHDRLLWVFLAGTLLYLIIIIWRVWVVKKRIAEDWYGKQIRITSGAKYGIIITACAIPVIRIIFTKIDMGNMTAFWILAIVFFALLIICIPFVDLGMRYYYFSRLSGSEQSDIVQGKHQCLRGKKMSKIYLKTMFTERIKCGNN